MMNRSIVQSAGRWLVVSALVCFGFAMAQSEPTLNQIYQTAQSGQLEQAQVMMQQVLVAHPGSGKAHFVQAELFARQGKMGQAREALSMAEKISPGLSFAKPEAVQALRAQLAASGRPVAGSAAPHGGNAAADYSPPSAPSQFPWGVALALGGALIGIAIFLLRKKPAPSYEPQPRYAAGGGLSGPQGFGMGNTIPGAAVQQTYGQAAGTGLGGRIMGGVATGLAVGAGVMAAEAIGRSLTGHHDQGARPSDGVNDNNFQSIDSNANMGGQNFGVSDAGSWDDAGGSDVGGDWDS